MKIPDPGPVRAFLDDRHVELASEIAGFAERKIASLPEPPDDGAARGQARAILSDLGKGGWLKPIVDQDLRACCLIREALAAASPLADAVFALQALGTTPIVMAGSSDLKDRWIPRMIAGQAMGAFAMTESGAGSDVASLATSARRNGTDYILQGSKTLISNAGIADFYTVFASTDSTKGSKGISCFVVAADTPGLRFVGPQVLSAPHPLGEIAFADCHVAVGSRLGEEGEGYRLGLTVLDRLRATVAAAACGMAARALHEALAHATHRQQFGKPISDFQLIQEKLARMAVDLTASRLLVYRAAWEADRGTQRVTLESASAKAFATEAAQRIVDDAIQICGGRALLASHPLDRLYRSVRALRIYEGTTEIQHLVIAGQLLRSVKETAP